jgi:hypothetical protein
MAFHRTPVVTRKPVTFAKRLHIDFDPLQSSIFDFGSRTTSRGAKKWKDRIWQTKFGPPQIWNTLGIFGICNVAMIYHDISMYLGSILSIPTSETLIFAARASVWAIHMTMVILALGGHHLGDSSRCSLPIHGDPETVSRLTRIHRSGQRRRIPWVFLDPQLTHEQKYENSGVKTTCSW